ncbi:hypothetical protein ACOJVU_17625 [Mycobacterium sp. THU-M104]
MRPSPVRRGGFADHGPDRPMRPGPMRPGPTDAARTDAARTDAAMCEAKLAGRNTVVDI